MRSEKQQIEQTIRGLMESSRFAFLVTYKGLNAEAFADLRGELTEHQAECHVVPNRLLKRALVAQGVVGIPEETLTGDTALVTGSTDSLAVAKQLRTFLRTHAQVSFKLGIIAGKVCSAADAHGLADLPPREVQLAQLLGLLQTPAGQLVNVLNAKLASIVYVLNAYLSDKERAA